MFIHSKEQEEVKTMQLHNIFIHSQWPFIVEITNKKWNSSYYTHNLEKTKNQVYNMQEETFFIEEEGFSSINEGITPRSHNLTYTISSKDEPRCLECLVNDDSLPRKKHVPLYFIGHIMVWSSAIISCMQIINYNMLASNNISSNFRLHSLQKPTHQISLPPFQVPPTNPCESFFTLHFEHLASSQPSMSGLMTNLPNFILVSYIRVKDVLCKWAILRYEIENTNK
jgi:hypothetical protein